MKYRYLYVTILLLVIFTIYSSNAYYYEDKKIVVSRSLVGDFTNVDFKIQIYVKNDDDYVIFNDDLNNNYVLDSYNCNNNSVIIYDEELGIINGIFSSRDKCNVYMQNKA